MILTCHKIIQTSTNISEKNISGGFIMNTETRVKILENAYIGILVDSIYHYSKQGVLDNVIEDKKKIQMLMGKDQCVKFGITKPEDVFNVLSGAFNCAKWEFEHNDNGFEAKAKACKLCAFAKKVGIESPCYLYCLNPMEGMVKGLDATLDYEASETLWDGKECRVKVINK